MGFLCVHKSPILLLTNIRLKLLEQVQVTRTEFWSYVYDPVFASAKTNQNRNRKGNTPIKKAIKSTKLKSKQVCKSHNRADYTKTKECYAHTCTRGSSLTYLQLIKIKCSNSCQGAFGMKAVFQARSLFLTVQSQNKIPKLDDQAFVNFLYYPTSTHSTCES